jgi:8-oxo-dGTP diphosphatase
MSKERFKAVPAVYLIMEKDEQILLMRRCNTGYEDGKYMVPGGHVEANEPPTGATVREAKEEVGVEIDPKDLQLVHMIYRAAHDLSGERVDLFFKTSTWQGEPTIMEPEKCDDLQWFPLKELPQNIPAYVRTALNNYQERVIYSEVDWE